MNLVERIHRIQQDIQQEAIAYHRDKHSVRLIAVSKGQTPEKIAAAFHAGMSDFAENYVQEALLKQQVLSSCDITWHFIGAIQSNKTDLIAKHFEWVHTICRQKIARRLNELRPETMPKLNVCIQVNLEREASKSGMDPNDVASLVKEIGHLSRLRLRGLMIIPSQHLTDEAAYGVFRQLSTLMQTLNQTCGVSMDTLSMGMSKDYRMAIKAGSTMVRIGKAIFDGSIK